MKKSFCIACLLALACSLGCRFGTPNRPANVPADAKWAGGPDGGHWFDCRMAGKEPAAFFDCTIYNDHSGAVEAEGSFSYGERKSASSEVSASYELVGTPFPRVDYRFYDGEVIHLQGSWVLVPDGEITYPFGDGHGKRVKYEEGRQVGPEVTY